VNALEATLKYGKPHEQGTAVAIAGRDRRRDWLPLVVAQLGNDYPLVRYFARQAVETNHRSAATHRHERTRSRYGQGDRASIWPTTPGAHHD